MSTNITASRHYAEAFAEECTRHGLDAEQSAALYERALIDEAHLEKEASGITGLFSPQGQVENPWTNLRTRNPHTPSWLSQDAPGGKRTALHPMHRAAAQQKLSDAYRVSAVDTMLNPEKYSFGGGFNPITDAKRAVRQAKKSDAAARREYGMYLSGVARTRDDLKKRKKVLSDRVGGYDEAYNRHVGLHSANMDGVGGLLATLLGGDRLTGRLIDRRSRNRAELESVLNRLRALGDA
jgi:hypothetical protein